MDDKIYKIRHSLSHVLALAVKRIYQEVKFAIGPPIENGFYYDFDLETPIKEEDFPKIEEEMIKILSGGHDFIYKVISKAEAREVFKEQPYKLDLIERIEGDSVSTYTILEFCDLCKGPHVTNTREINYKAFKLSSIAGAYWRGDEANPMLLRIYAFAFENPKELKEYLNFLEEAKKRDHRKIAKELDLFSLQEDAGPGLIYWHPNGAIIRYTIESFWREEHLKNGYEFLYTPHIGKSWLWETSGHLGFYKESMYSSINVDEDKYFIKPMNCPFHIMVYKNSPKSYRDLPKRWAELGTVYRYEKSGTLHGSLRVRGFTQDDAHIFCTEEQVAEEVDKAFLFSLNMLKTFGFNEFAVKISTKPEKSVGEDSYWEIATESLIDTVKKNNIEYTLDDGGGAFYGPKIDLKVKDAINREWQLSTIQFDFNMPLRFNLKYTTSDGSEKMPFMVHRALLGSLERFFGILIENYKGAFPVWLSPIHAVIIPVSDKFNSYALKLEEMLKAKGFRIQADLLDDRMNYKIRKHGSLKVPYLIIVGEKEMNDEGVSIRLRAQNDQQDMKIEEFVEFLGNKIKNKEYI